MCSYAGWTFLFLLTNYSNIHVVNPELCNFLHSARQCRAGVTAHLKQTVITPIYSQGLLWMCSFKASSIFLFHFISMCIFLFGFQLQWVFWVGGWEGKERFTGCSTCSWRAGLWVCFLFFITVFSPSKSLHLVINIPHSGFSCDRSCP